MDFFEHQDAARKGSRRLIWLFALAVVVITLVVAALAGGAVLLIAAQGGGQRGTGLTAESVARLPLWETVGLAAGITLGMIALGSLYKTSRLAGGGAAVAHSLGATAIDTDTTDPYARRLLNVIEEMAIAAGCPVPAVYVMEDEDGINAFAAGWSMDDAVIGVTHGALRRLTRDELQGIVAHEFSHILHGDMRLNLRLTGLVFGILALSVVGGVVMRMVAEGATRGRYHRRDRRSDDGGAVAVVVAIFVAGVVLYAVGSLGVFFGRLIQAAVSRQREFLADASAVQYTRNPEGIGHALLKVGGLAQGSRLQNRPRQRVSTPVLRPAHRFGQRADRRPGHAPAAARAHRPAAAGVGRPLARRGPGPRSTRARRSPPDLVFGGCGAFGAFGLDGAIRRF